MARHVTGRFTWSETHLRGVFEAMAPGCNESVLVWRGPLGEKTGRWAVKPPFGPVADSYDWVVRGPDVKRTKTYYGARRAAEEYLDRCARR